MSDFENPYQSPESPVVPETQNSSGNLLTETMIKYLVEASPWLRFIGIIGYIGSGIMLITGILVPLGLFASSAIVGDLGGLSSWIFLLIYLPAGIIMFFPAHFTHNFGHKIRNYKFSNSNEDLEQAFKNNKSLWKFYGIICIIYLAIIPLFIVIAIVGGVIAALN